MTNDAKTREDWAKIWAHFNRLQKRVMATETTRKEFFAQSETDRLEFYSWVQNQCGAYSCWM